MKNKIFLLTLFSCFILNAQVDSTGIQPQRMVEFDIDSTEINTNDLFNMESDMGQNDTIATPAVEMPGTAVQMMAQYILKGLDVSGGTPYSTNQILRFTGLQLGEELEIPGAKINNAIKKLWRTNLFSDVEIFATKIIGNEIYLRVNLVALPKISEVEIDGVKKSLRETFIKDNGLKENEKITQNLINQTRINIKDYFTEKGFPDAKVNFITTPVEGKNLTENVKIVIDKGPRVKVKDIIIEGNQELKSGMLRKKGFKNTSRTDLLSILKSSKLIPQKYEEDKETLIDVYKGKGFRDAK